MNKQQIGRAGELLVQYKLLRSGIESSSLTTDSGIDLVAFSKRQQKPFTIQVKTNEKPKPGGGKGAFALDWWLREDSPADLVALVDLSEDRVWLFTHVHFVEVAQQHSKGKYHFYIYLDENVRTKKVAKLSDFIEFVLEKQLSRIFGV